MSARPSFRRGLVSATLLASASLALSRASRSAEPAAPSRCSALSLRALGGLTCEISEGVRGRTVYSVARSTSDRGAPSEELAVHFAKLLAESGGPRLRLVPATDVAALRSAARPDESLLFVTLDVRGGTLAATTDSYPARPGFWDRVRGLSSAPPTRRRGTRRIDAEVAAFFPAVPLSSGRISTAAVSTTDVVAMVCGDLDADGAAELVLIGRRRVQMGHLDGGRYSVRAERTWADLSPVAPAPLREPIAAAVAGATGLLDVGITDRAVGLRLGPSLEKVAVLRAPVPWSSVGCVARSGVAVGSPVPCVDGEANPVRADGVVDVDAVAGAAIVDRTGAVRHVAVFRRRTDASLTLLDDAGRTAQIPNAGAAVAVGDIDLDGNPEIAVSANTPKPAEDGIFVHTWYPDGTVKARFSLSIPEGVRALAICPVDGPRQAPILTATANGLGVVQ